MYAECMAGLGFGLVYNATWLHPWIHQLYLIEIIKAAALFVREWTQDFQETGPFYTDAALTAISRVVWTQDVALAERLMDIIILNDAETNRFTIQLVNPTNFLKIAANPELRF